MLHRHVTELIGNTPLLRLDPARHGIAGVDLYAKLEFLNPFGSVKDRIAWGMLRDHVERLAAEGRTVIEASSGNTAKALRVLTSMYGLDLRVLTNRVKVGEVRDVLHLLGTEVHELPGLSECPDPTVPDDVLSLIAATMAAEPGRYFHTSQYTNPDNIHTHHDTTGRELAEDLGRVDLLIGGLGTTGSTRGTAEYLRRLNPDLRLLGVVSTREDFIPGIRSEAELWEVGLFEPDAYEAIVPVASGPAITATLELIRDFGILAGPTTGAAYEALRRHLAEESAEHSGGNPSSPGRPLTAVLIACDRVEWYLSYLRARRPELFGQARGSVVAELAASDAATAPQLSADELAARAADPQLIRIDTRGAMAYRIGHVPGSLNIRDDLLEEMLAQGSPFPPGAALVLICPVGERSGRLAAYLRGRGHQAYSLTGGVVAWRDAGRPLETGLG